MDGRHSNVVLFSKPHSTLPYQQIVTSRLLIGCIFYTQFWKQTIKYFYRRSMSLVLKKLSPVLPVPSTSFFPVKINSIEPLGRVAVAEERIVCSGCNSSSMLLRRSVLPQNYFPLIVACFHIHCWFQLCLIFPHIFFFIISNFI